MSDRCSDWAKDNVAKRCSRPSTINSTAAVDISPPRLLASYAIRYFNTRDEILPSVVDGYPYRDAFPPSISSITDILDRSLHCRGHPHRESLVLLVCCVPVSLMISMIVDLFESALFPLTINKTHLLSTLSVFLCLMSIMFGSSAWLSTKLRSEESWCTRTYFSKVFPGKHDRLEICSSASWFHIVLARRDRRWWKRKARSLSRREAHYFFADNSKESRARWVTLRSQIRFVEEETRQVLVPGSTFPSSCLPFVSALCTLRGTSGSCLHRPPPDGI